MDMVDLIIKDKIKREIKEKGLKEVIIMIDRLKEEGKYLETIEIYENMIRQILREDKDLH